MSNTYVDTTGVLVLEKPTPVIKALFGNMELDINHPGDGRVYIANIAESTVDSWDSVLENILELFEEQQIPIGEDVEHDIKTALEKLAIHIGSAHEEKLKTIIESIDFDCSADINDIFEIAVCINDGHNLKSTTTQTSWHCSKPRLFEFGGCSLFNGKYFTNHISTEQIFHVGENINSLLEKDDFNQVADIFYKRMENLLAGIKDESQRELVQHMVFQRANVKHD